MCSPIRQTPSRLAMDQILGGRRPGMSLQRDRQQAVGLTRRSILRAGAAGMVAVVGGKTFMSTAALAQTLNEAGICVDPQQLSIQLFTMAETMADDFEGTMAALAQIGYKIVEHAGTDAAEDGSAEAFRSVLNGNGISISSGHRGVPFPYDDEAWQATLDETETLGATRINEPLPSFLLPDFVIAMGGGPVGTVTSVQYAQFADALNQAGAAAQARGITVGYHNHNPEFLMLPDSPGTKGYDVLMAETDPALVDFEMDVYWVTAGGEDPVTRLQMHEGRFGQLHIKDMAEDGSITFPGTGIIDFAPILAEGARQGLAEYIVEQDNAGAEAVQAAQLGHDLLSAGCAAAPAPPTAVEVLRIAGEGRAETAAALSARTFATASTVHVASGDTFADGLPAGAAAAAGETPGPVLLVTRTRVPDATRVELQRLAPATIVVVGGTDAISEEVFTELSALAGEQAVRAAGEDRYVTAAEVCRMAFPDATGGEVVIASGEDFADGLAGGALAARLGGPLLTTRRASLPDPIREQLTRLQPQRITVMGGDVAISTAVEQELRALAAEVRRVEGPTRIDTAAAASAAVEQASGTVILATAADFADALAATPAARVNSAPVLLVERDVLPEPTRQALIRLRPTTILVLGGTSAISEEVAAAAAAALA